MLFTKVKILSASICVALSLFVLSNNSVLADDGKLTNQKAKQLISELFKTQPDNLVVIGVLELSQNVAQADVVITNLLVARPKNDAVTAYAFGPGGGSYRWSGRGKANFVHYNDGRWTLTSLDTEIGSFTPELPASSAEPSKATTSAQQEAQSGSPQKRKKAMKASQYGDSVPTAGQTDCRVILFRNELHLASPYQGGCKDGLAEGEGTYSYTSDVSPEITIVKGEFHEGKLNGHVVQDRPGMHFEGEFLENRVIHSTINGRRSM
jgi:hypothetical protein